MRNIEVLPNKPLPVRGILTSAALHFVAALHEEFGKERKELLLARAERQKRIDDGEMPNFLPETSYIRKSDWTVCPAPPDLQDRRVEITGPASSRKMVINALNSGAKVYMADAEDSESPTWANLLNGQKNIYDAVRRSISYQSPEGKNYKLNEKTAKLMFRPRGLHLLEKHILVDGKPVPASLFDLGIYLYHNACAQLYRDAATPAIYWPKTESHQEVRWLNKVLNKIENKLGISEGSIKVCVLIETILAVFEMDEILFELQDRSIGLNCGRWDYIFSFIKKFRNHPEFVLPDRAQLTMDQGFLKPYVNLLVKTCHRRGAHAIGGMTAQIPIKDDKKANHDAMLKVKADKAREVQAGHDGTWVAHPDLVSIAKEIFDLGMPNQNQIHITRDDVNVSAAKLLRVPVGTITENGLRNNIRVGIQYIDNWCRGTGCVPINNLMEDAATAEICRAQVWQWIKHRCSFANGRLIESELVWKFIQEAREELGGGENLRMASGVFYALVIADRLWDFMTIPLYGQILGFGKEA